MNKKIGAISLAFVMLLTVGAYAVSGDNDVTGDPLISLSYLNEVFWPKIEKAIENAVEGKDFKDDNDGFWWDSEDGQTTEETTADSGASEGAASSSQYYEVLELKLGDVVVSTTPCEIILRSGSANAYLDGNASGIADLTDGGELKEGDSLSANHLLLIPRGDGRGFAVSSDVAYVMVRGGYEIVE